MDATNDRDRRLSAHLQFHWDEAYEISEALGVWRAVRRDTQVALVAASAGELASLIAADYARHPVPRDDPA